MRKTCIRAMLAQVKIPVMVGKEVSAVFLCHYYEMDCNCEDCDLMDI